MITVPAGVRIHLALGTTDMRKGFDGLSLLVQEVLRTDPFSGHLFVFRGKRSNHTPFSIPIALGRSRVPLAPTAWRATAALPALGTGRS